MEQFFNQSDKLDKNSIPEELKIDKNIVKEISAVDRMFDEEERIIYETRMQLLADIESKIASAEEKGTTHLRRTTSLQNK